MTPHWQLKHGWYIEDIRDTLEEIWEFKKMLREYVDSPCANNLREVIKGLKRYSNIQVAAYEKTYGDKPDVRTIRKEVESES